MTNKQEPIIYIEKENYVEAEFMSRNFVNKEIKNRAYVNALGAELVMKYLSSEGINVSDIRNIHSISKILENIDISDILLPNIHIDVRVIFDTKQIFIPKSHFQMEIEPDIYVVLKFEENFKHAELLGYFKPSQINRRNENKEYYFFEKNKLSSTDSLTKFIKDFTGKTSRNLSQEDFERGKELSISLADHNISVAEEKELLELLLLSSALRESILEFDNFETLSYNTAPILAEMSNALIIEEEILKEDTTEGADEVEADNIDSSSLASMALNEDLAIEDVFPETEESVEKISLEETSETEESVFNIDEIIDLIESSEEPEKETFETENIVTEEEITVKKVENIELEEQLPDNPASDAEEPVIDEIKPLSVIEETLQVEEEILPIKESLQLEETLNIDEEAPTLNLDEVPTLEIDSTDFGNNSLGGDLPDETQELTETLDLIEEEGIIPQKVTLPEIKEVYSPLPLEEKMSVDSIFDQTVATIDEPTKIPEKADNSDLDEAASATAVALANAVATEEAKAASDETIKLTSVADDLISDVVQNLENTQQKSLNRIDYEKTEVIKDIEGVSEHMVATVEDLFIAKMESNIEAEESEEFEGSIDLTNLNTVETFEEEEFIQESVDFSNMKTVSSEDLLTQGIENPNTETLSDFDMSVDNFNLPDVNLDKEEGVVDLPQFSAGGFTINEDGSSPMGEMLDVGMATEESEQNEELVNMEFNGVSLDFSSCMKPSTRRREESHSSCDDSKSTMDEETKKALLANNIIKSSDNDEVEEDFGEIITLPVDDEPFEIGSIDSIEETTGIIEEATNETSIENLFGDDETEVALVSNDELSFGDIETLEESSSDATSSEELFNDYEETSVETSNNEEFLAPSEEFSTDTFNVEDEKPKDTIQPEIMSEQQDWMNDTDYSTLENVETQNQEITEDFITEPDANQKEFPVTENSKVISDKTFQTGEIVIDINEQTVQQFEGHESLENLYDPNSKIPGGTLLQNPGRLGVNEQRRGTTGLLRLVGTLIVLALIGGIGFGIAKLFKAPTEEIPQPITDEPLTSSDNGVADTNTLNINPNNVVNMDNNYNAIEKSASTTVDNSSTNVTKAPSQKKGPAKAFVEIKEMKWTLPDYVSKNNQFQQYFQSVSKSLKLSLTTDLLLANDYIYTDKMRVAVTFEKDGTFGNSQIITSSGSNQIDKIVLQTVNQILKALKAPNSVGNDENTTAVLNIYF